METEGDVADNNKEPGDSSYAASLKETTQSCHQTHLSSSRIAIPSTSMPGGGDSHGADGMMNGGEPRLASEEDRIVVDGLFSLLQVDKVEKDIDG